MYSLRSSRAGRVVGDNASQAILSAIFGALGGVGSGLILSHFNSKRDTKIRRKDSAVELVEDIRCLAVTYWQKDGRDKLLEASIKANIEKLDGRLDELSRCCENSEVVFRTGLDSFYSEITSATFETNDRRADPAKVNSIRQCAKDLVAAVIER